MMKETKTTLSHIPESEKVAPELMTKAVPFRDALNNLVKNKFVVSIIHPNTKEELYSETIIAKDIFEALSYAKKVKESEFSLIETEYQEVKFIPAPKKGKTKLFTKKGVIEGNMSQEDFDNLDTIDPDFIVDAEFLELSNQVKKNLINKEKNKENTKKTVKKQLVKDKKAKVTKKTKTSKKVIKTKKNVKKVNKRKNKK